MPIGSTLVQYVCGVSDRVWSQGNQPSINATIESKVDMVTPNKDSADP